MSEIIASNDTALVSIDGNGKRPVPPMLVGKNFQPGKSGNPNGGNTTQKLQRILRDFFDEKHPEQRDKTRLRVYLETAIKRDPRSIFQMFPYCYAKVPEQVALQNPDGTNLAPIQIMIVNGVSPKEKDTGDAI